MRFVVLRRKKNDAEVVWSGVSLSLYWREERKKEERGKTITNDGKVEKNKRRTNGIVIKDLERSSDTCRILPFDS